MIGVFDSGIGGLTVAREVMRQLPGFSVLYLGDTARTPYGNKSSELIKRYALESAEWMINHGAKLLIVACNTISAVAIQTLRDRFKVPVFDVIIPTIREATRKISDKEKRIGVIGTRATIGSRVYETLIHEINPEAQVFSASCPLFVPLVEEGWINRSETSQIARVYLEPLRTKNIESLILACTHYPLLFSIIKSQFGRRTRIVDSAEATVRHVKAFLDSQPALVDQLSKGNRHEFCLTDVAPQHNAVASAWLGRPVEFSRAELKPLPVKGGK